MVNRLESRAGEELSVWEVYKKTNVWTEDGDNSS